MNRFRCTAAAALGTVVLAVPVASATAAAPRTAVVEVVPKKKIVIVTRKVSGAPAQADQWGYVQVTLTVKKTTTIAGRKKTIGRKITAISIPQYPNHTDRSVYISQQALPYLMQETLKAQSANIQMVSGATYTSDAYVQSLQAAILQEKKV